MESLISTVVKTQPRITFAYCCLILSLMTGKVSAEENANAQLARTQLEEIAENMVSALQDPSLRTNVHQIEQLVQRILVPHIDFRTSSNLVLGPHWKDTNEKQRASFINEFQAFLVRFYTGALASYIDSETVPVNVMSFREDPRTKGERQVFVRSHIGQSGDDEITVDYRMYWRGAWKIIDVSVAGISMVQSYRSNFTSTVEQQGIEVLIAQLQERNRSFANN
ncbi:MAG: ABC transporter substrate-binding protein [Gammaproteobacteria bacterium]